MAMSILLAILREKYFTAILYSCNLERWREPKIPNDVFPFYWLLKVLPKVFQICTSHITSFLNTFSERRAFTKLPAMANVFKQHYKTSHLQRTLYNQSKILSNRTSKTLKATSTSHSQSARYIIRKTHYYIFQRTSTFQESNRYSQMWLAEAKKIMFPLTTELDLI